MHERHQRIRGPARDDLIRILVKRYNAGVPIRRLATEYHWSYGSIHRLLREGNVSFRSRGIPRKPPPNTEPQQVAA
jgi:hypothetical protein